MTGPLLWVKEIRSQGLPFDTSIRASQITNTSYRVFLLESEATGI